MTTETKTREIILTGIFTQLMDAWLQGKRRVFIEGGTWASKTYSVMQLLIFILQGSKDVLLASVTSESMPHLKRGAIRDFLSIMDDDLLEAQWNKTDFIYTFPQSKCQLEFISADQPAKLQGGRRDILFANEVNNIYRDSYRQADMRTRLFTACDWNPVSEFWFHEERLADEPENVYIHATYEDASDVVPQSIRDDIESYKDRDPNWWRIYGLGLVGKLEGLVYPFDTLTWQVDELPKGDYFFGLDFGFLGDPVVLVKNVIVGDKLYSEQLLYETGLTNDEIARKMDLFGVRQNHDEIYADPSEPKSIEEIHLKGFNIKEAEKGKGSVDYGIQKVNQYYQHWTKESVDCIKDQRNLRYIQDKAGTFTDKTTHKWSHGPDARRYAVATHRGSNTSRPAVSGRGRFR